MQQTQRRFSLSYNQKAMLFIIFGTFGTSTKMYTLFQLTRSVWKIKKPTAHYSREAKRYLHTT